MKKMCCVCLAALFCLTLCAASACGCRAVALKDGGLNCAALADEDGRVLTGYDYGNVEVISPEWALLTVFEDVTEACSGLKPDELDWDVLHISGADENIPGAGSFTGYLAPSRVDIYSMEAGRIVGTRDAADVLSCQVMDGCLALEDHCGEIVLYDAYFTPLGTVDPALYFGW